MSNRQLKEHLDTVWDSLKGLKAGEVEYRIQMSKQLAQPIVGVSQVERIRNSSLLKLLIYELIIFVDQKMTANLYNSTKLSKASTSNQESVDYPLMYVRDVKQLMENIGRKNKKGMSQLTMDKFQFKALLRKINSLEEELRQEALKKSYAATTAIDPEGTQAMIEQLEILLKKKERRIKQLNNELQFNFEDKEDLENDIQILEEKNLELEETVQRLEEENQRCKEDFQKFKTLQNTELLSGASCFMNSEFPHLKSQLSLKHEESTSPEKKAKLLQDMLSSTKVLSKYCIAPQQKKDAQMQTPKKLQQTEQKTVKKALERVISEEYDIEEENLLESMRIYNKERKEKEVMGALVNEDQTMERMLFIQATFIERAMENLMN